MHVLVNEFIPYRWGHNTVTPHSILPQPSACSLTQLLFLPQGHFMCTQSHAHSGTYTLRHMPTRAHAYSGTCPLRHMPTQAHAYSGTCPPITLHCLDENTAYLIFHLQVIPYAYICICVYTHFILSKGCMVFSTWMNHVLFTLLLVNRYLNCLQSLKIFF